MGPVVEEPMSSSYILTRSSSHYLVVSVAAWLRPLTRWEVHKKCSHELRVLSSSKNYFLLKCCKSEGSRP